MVTLIVSHSDCATCLDAQVDKGSIIWPDSVQASIQRSENISIVFSNKLLPNILFGKPGGGKFNYTYMITGRPVYYYKSPKARGFVPVLDVYKYRYLKEKEIEEEIPQR